MFLLNPNLNFLRKAKKLLKKNSNIKKKLNASLQILERDPTHPALKSHKIISEYDAKIALSSRVSSDIRIIWRYRKGDLAILDIIDIGGHSGKRKVYR